MTGNNKSPPCQITRRSILTLDKSNEPFQKQVSEACDILGIKIDARNTPISLSQQEHQEVGPYRLQEEWALRWLLKKLQSDDIHQGHPCLEFKAWLLLRSLVARIPLTNVARLLNTYNFTAIVALTLQHLQQEFGLGHILSQQENEDALATADSSSVTLEVSPTEAPQRSKKRKRDGTSTSPSKPCSIASPHTDALYKSICSSTRDVEALTRDLPDGSRGFAVEYMKATLRSSPGKAAAMLGSFFATTDAILRRSKEYPEDMFDGCISPMLAIWNLRSDTEDDPSGHSSFNAFSTHCLLPLLHLLITYQTMLSSWPETHQVMNSLELLLAKYVIFPARASSSKRSRIGSGETANPSSYKDLLSPLSNATIHEPQDSFPAATLYSIAIRCMPRETPKQRTAENPWLQSLFKQLLENSLSISSSPSGSIESSIRLLKSMLHEAVDHNVLLDTSLLETVLSSFSGVLSKDGELYRVDWDLVRLCLKLNPDVFVLRSPQRTSNNLLTSLLSRIREMKFDRAVNHGPEYSEMLSNVVLPLVQAFAHARDLPRFIDHWKEELTHCQEKLEDVDIELSIWEDDHLSLTVADLMKSTLTTGQIRKFILLADADISLLASSESKRSFASLVILDCAINGCTNDANVEGLKKTTPSIYLSLIKIASNDIHWHMPKMWMVWRTLATINIRWKIPHTMVDIQSTEHCVIRRALKLIDCDALRSKFAEGLHALNYLVSFAALEKSGTQVLSQSPYQIIRQTFEIVLNRQDALYDSLRLEESAASRHSGSAPQWNGRTLRVASAETFMMACQAQVLLSRDVFHCLDVDTFSRFFRQLFFGAVWQSMCDEQHIAITPPSLLSYKSLWQRLVRSNLLEDNALAADCYRKLLISEYLRFTQASKSEKHFSHMRHQLALESLQYIPVHAFDRKERSTISNQLLCEIVQKTAYDKTTARDISLLVKLISIPSKSMNVLTKLNGLSEQDPLGKENVAMLINLGHSLDGYEPEVHITALSGLRCLARQIMKHQLTTIREKSSVDYLTGYYLQIAQKDFTTEPSESCASAVLLSASLEFYSDHYNEFPKALQAQMKSLGDLRQQHLRTLRRRLDVYSDGMTSEPGPRRTLTVISECLASYVDLICTDSTFNEVTSQLSRISTELSDLVGSWKLEISDGEKSSVNLLSKRLTRLEFLLESRHGELSHPLSRAETSLEHESLREKRQLTRYLHHAISELEFQRQIELLRILSHKEKDRCLKSSDLLLLQRVILVLKDSTQHVEQATAALSQVYNALCIELSQPMDIRTRILTMQCMHLLLQEQHRSISQLNVDNTLATVAVGSSRLKSESQGKHTGMIYLGLCRLFSTMLAIHRKKLGGRYHLIVPALQGLLRLLFIPYVTNSASLEQRSAGVFSLGVTHAAAYARLLTMLCSPTVSAVSRSRKHNSRQELNDETKKARSIAGQHLPYLIMEFCTYQLKERLLPEAKAVLNPGLYAVLDVMQPEVTRTMNAAMDSASRSIFKALYEEYRRFSRGKLS